MHSLPGSLCILASSSSRLEKRKLHVEVFYILRCHMESADPASLGPLTDGLYVRTLSNHRVLTPRAKQEGSRAKEKFEWGCCSSGQQVRFAD